MAREVPSNVHYPFGIETTAMLGVDFQVGFGDGFEPVPDASAAVENFRRASARWRELGGTVIHVQTVYTPDRQPQGRIVDFVPNVAEALAEGARDAEPYAELVDPADELVYKRTFSAVASSDLMQRLESLGFDSVVLGGLTTPICVQTTADALSMSGFKVTLLHDACASQAIGELSAQEAHLAAVQRMAYLFTAACTTSGFLASLDALPVAGG
ncbi:MAG TPA: cysteine hydrolase [Solirubrobacteraceae bacterium]|jgi:nicotinamidase-related amidase|nr:cysteine hydrolase [Solirubrobacteraceae bacterium]